MRIYNLSNLLAPRYFPLIQYRNFRRLMKKTGEYFTSTGNRLNSLGLLISGSVALQFFMGTTWSESDLDLYVHLEGADLVGEWLQLQGYSLLSGQRFQNHPHWNLPCENTYTGHMLGIRCVFTFRHHLSAQQVQLIVATRNVMEIIFRFHSSTYIQGLSAITNPVCHWQLL